MTSWIGRITIKLQLTGKSRLIFKFLCITEFSEVGSLNNATFCFIEMIDFALHFCKLLSVIQFFFTNYFLKLYGSFKVRKEVKISLKYLGKHDINIDDWNYEDDSS